MRIIIRNALSLLTFSLFAQLATADVSGNWTFAVVLGEAGSGRMSGSYSGQLANGPIAGTYEGNNFEFTFTSVALGADITYRGELESDGTVKGSVIVQGNSMGTFTGKKKI